MLEREHDSVLWGHPSHCQPYKGSPNYQTRKRLLETSNQSLEHQLHRVDPIFCHQLSQLVFSLVNQNQPPNLTQDLFPCSNSQSLKDLIKVWFHPPPPLLHLPSHSNNPSSKPPLTLPGQTNRDKRYKGKSFQAKCLFKI